MIDYLSTLTTTEIFERSIKNIDKCDQSVAPYCIYVHTPVEPDDDEHLQILESLVNTISSIQSEDPIKNRLFILAVSSYVNAFIEILYNMDNIALYLVEDESFVELFSPQSAHIWMRMGDKEEMELANITANFAHDRQIYTVLTRL